MIFTLAMLRLGVLATWLHLIISCVASPASPSSAATILVLSNTRASANAIETVTVFPQTRDTLDDLDREIRAIIKTGKVTAEISQHSTEYKGIVCWYVEAPVEEIHTLESTVAGVSKHLNCFTIQFASSYEVHAGADSICRSISYQTTILFNRHNLLTMIRVSSTFLPLVHYQTSDSHKELYRGPPHPRISKCCHGLRDKLSKASDHTRMKPKLRGIHTYMSLIEVLIPIIG